MIKSALHLPRESPFAKTNGVLFRQKAMEAQLRSEDPSDLFFTASFSASEAVRVKLKERFLEFLKVQSREIEAAPPEELYQLNFDLFRI